MMLLVPLGLVCGLFAVVLWGASAVLGAPSKELTRTSDDPKSRSQLAVLVARVALPLYLAGVVLTFVGVNRFPGAWVEHLAMMALVPAFVVALGSTKAAAVGGLSPLATVSALMGLGIFFVPSSGTAGDITSVWPVIYAVSGATGAGLIACAVSVATRRLLATQFGARSLMLASFGIGMMAVFSGWVGPHDSAPFLVFSDSDGQVAEAVVVVSERDTGERLEKHVPVRSDHPAFGALRDVSKWVLATSTVLILMSWLVPTLFYKAWGMISAGAGALALTSVLLLMVVLGAFRAEVTLDPTWYRAWIEQVQLTGMDPPMVLHSVSLPPGPHRLSLLSAPESMIVFAFVVVAALLSALRLQTGWRTTRPVTPPQSNSESEAQALFEADFMRWALPFWTVSLAAGAIWGQQRWGLLYYGDPVLLLGLAIWLGIGVYFAVQALLPTKGNAPSLVVVSLGVLLLWLLVGPNLGWTVTSLYN